MSDELLKWIISGLVALIAITEFLKVLGNKK